jgi:hypothetical protein
MNATQFVKPRQDLDELRERVTETCLVDKAAEGLQAGSSGRAAADSTKTRRSAGGAPLRMSQGAHTR